MAIANHMDSGTGNVPWIPIAGVIATVSVFAIAQGLSYPLFTFLMQRQGMSPALIGLSAAMTPIGLIVSAPFVPVVTKMVGARKLAVICAILAALLFLLIGLLQNALAWFVLRFLVGVVIDPLYILSEVWMISLAPSAKRGRIMGIYTAIIGAGFAAGPLSLTLTGSQGWLPFAIAICAFLACAACLVAVGKKLPEMMDGEHHAPVSRFFKVAPALLLAVAVAAAFEQNMLSLMPVYGLHYGIGERTMSALLTVMIAGNIALQIPLGILAERLSARKVMMYCALLTLICVAFIPLVISDFLIWPLLFVVGAVSYTIYTMALIELGNRFTGAMLVAGNAAFGLMWGLGGIIGPPVAGSVMQVIGVQGLPLMLCILCATLLVFSTLRIRGRATPG